MKIADNKVVHLSYQLTIDGQIADKATAEKPLQFIFGLGYLLPKFEENIAKKEIGEIFEFMLPAAEGYGEVNPANVVDLPKNIFEIDGEFQESMVQVGRTLPMMNADGGVLQGTILAVEADSVKMDFNHPMAGKDLYFSGKVELVRDATEEELRDGLFGERKQGGCQCGGSCSGDCGEGCGEGSCNCSE